MFDGLAETGVSPTSILNQLYQTTSMFQVLGFSSAKALFLQCSV